MTTQLVCTFTLGDILFGIAVKNVQEVLRYQEMTPIPLASSMVRGLINLRGQIVTAIDMRARLELPPRDAVGDELPMNVVVQTQRWASSACSSTRSATSSRSTSGAYERAPETLAARFRHLVPGVYKLAGALLLLLDAERVAALGAAASASRARRLKSKSTPSPPIAAETLS